MQSVVGDRVRPGVWYCSQCPARAQIAQLFGRTLETEWARQWHYTKVHDDGAVIAVAECSLTQQLREEQFRRATVYDGEFDWAHLHRQVSVNDRRMAELPSVQSFGASARSRRRVRNCSVQTAEYALEAALQIQAYLASDDSGVW